MNNCAASQVNLLTRNPQRPSRSQAGLMPAVLTFPPRKQEPNNADPRSPLHQRHHHRRLQACRALRVSRRRGGVRMTDAESGERRSAGLRTACRGGERGRGSRSYRRPATTAPAPRVNLSHITSTRPRSSSETLPWSAVCLHARCSAPRRALPSPRPGRAGRRRGALPRTDPGPVKHRRWRARERSRSPLAAVQTFSASARSGFGAVRRVSSLTAVALSGAAGGSDGLREVVGLAHAHCTRGSDHCSWVEILWHGQRSPSPANTRS